MLSSSWAGAVVTSIATAMLVAWDIETTAGIAVVVIVPKIWGANRVAEAVVEVTTGAGAAVLVIKDAFTVAWPTIAVGPVDVGIILVGTGGARVMMVGMAAGTADTAFAPEIATTVAVAGVLGCAFSFFDFLAFFFPPLGGPLFLGPPLHSLQRCL